MLSAFLAPAIPTQSPRRLLRPPPASARPRTPAAPRRQRLRAAMENGDSGLRRRLVPEGGGVLAATVVPPPEVAVEQGEEPRAPRFWGLVAIVAVHVGLATCALCLLEGWSVLDAAYFAVTCASTVGYGDIVVTRDVSKLFVAGYALVSVALIGGIVSAVVDKLVERQGAMAERVRARFASSRVDGSGFGGRGGEGAPDLVETTVTAKAEARGRLFASGFLLVACCVIGGGLYGFMQSLSLVDTVHLVTATLTTVGYGDLSPQTRVGKGFAIVWLLLSTLGLANLLGQWTEYKMRQAEVALATQLTSAKMSENVYNEIDKNGDGRLDQMEYITYVLSQLGKTTPGEVAAIRRRFKELDTDNNNYLTRGEVELQ